MKTAGLRWLLYLFLVLPHPRSLAAVSCDIDHAVIDGVRFNYATSVEICGICKVEDDFDLGAGEAALKAVRVNGRPNQDDIHIHLHAPRPKPESKDKESVMAKSLKRMTPGKWYKVRGDLTDGTTAGSEIAFVLIAETCETIPETDPGIHDFADREARFDGTAGKNGSFVSGKETAKLDGLHDWPEKTRGKKISVSGTIRHDSAGWHIEQPQWRLTELTDQTGHEVTLDGRFWSRNGVWWFDYRGQRLVITGRDDRPLGSETYMVTGPGGNLRLDAHGFAESDVAEKRPLQLSSSDHGRPARVAGHLVRQLRPSLEQISEKEDRDLVSTYVVRRANVEFLEKAEDDADRFRTLYPKPFRMADGIPELIPEPAIRRNIIGNETTTMLQYERNIPAIHWTMRHLSPAVLDTLAKRMEDASLPMPSRLLYAAMLASANDPRGRDFLTTSASGPDTKALGDSLYCLGAVAWLMPHDGNNKAALAWMEPTLVKLFTRRDADGHHTAACIATGSTCIPEIMLSLDSEAACNALLDFALSQKDHKPGNPEPDENSIFGFPLSEEAAATNIMTRICRARALPMAVLRRLEAASRNISDESEQPARINRRALLSQFLLQKNPDAISLFLDDLCDDFTFMDVHESLSPPIVDALKANLGKMKDAAAKHARMLISLGDKDPIPALHALLDNPDWKDKNLVLFELAHLHDSRSVTLVAKKLREAPKSYLHNADSRLESAMAVQHALNAIAASGTPDAIPELISLLPVDLSRFGTYINRDGFRRIVAARLIELTGESFGTDELAWQKWWSTQAATTPRPE